jgi:hypothetical protein
MSATPSITIVKEFKYRGRDEEWSNSYHFSGATPGDNPSWKELGDAIWAKEKACLRGDVKVVQYYGYQAGTVASVAQIDRRGEPVNLRGGALSGVGGQLMSGDQAAMCRALVGNSVKGKKVYVRKFFHGGFISDADADKVSGAMVAALIALAEAMTDGTLPGGRKWVSPSGAQATQPSAPPFVTTRTLKRRGARPSP